MMILVVYEDGRTDLIAQQNLQSVIESGMVTKFRRDGQWANLKEDSLRQSETENFSGPDRRVSFSYH